MFEPAWPDSLLRERGRHGQVQPTLLPMRRVTAYGTYETMCDIICENFKTAHSQPDHNSPPQAREHHQCVPDEEISDEDRKAGNEAPPGLKTGFNDADIEGMSQDNQEVELCWSCGWTSTDQKFSSYDSSIRIVYTHGSV